MTSTPFLSLFHITPKYSSSLVSIYYHVLFRNFIKICMNIDMLLMSHSSRCRTPQRKISYFLLLKGTTFVGDVQRHWSFLNILDFLFKSKNSFLTLCWLQVFFCYQKGSSKWGFQTSNYYISYEYYRKAGLFSLLASSLDDGKIFNGILVKNQ